ncbi:MAG: reverse transcriptase domain-containing protein [Lyngbya sp.]|nr:reverse transcriptase domain-containing protein [Lyngbya sp.]
MKNNLYSERWKSQSWKKLRQNLFRLQHRIWKASRVGDNVRVRNLQKLVLRSLAGRMLAVRQVTQLNKGKKTAGIDGKKSLSFKQRFELIELLQKYVFNWKHQGLRECPIPKSDGTKRILKMPTINDRAWQCLIKYAIEPAHEAHFHERSYGFRPGRSAHDCQKMLFNNLSSLKNGHRKYILEMDIDKCFDRIDQKDLLNRVICPKSIQMCLWRCLKADVNPEMYKDYEDSYGVPQGSIISPLLANISLDGIEKLGNCIRYADDLVFIIDPKKYKSFESIGDITRTIQMEVQSFLQIRGLETKPSKTRLVHSTDGFDFLGWHFYVQKNNSKFRSVPSEKNFKAFKKKVKFIVNNSTYGAKVKAEKLSSVVRGWRNYHRHCQMDGSRFSLWDIDERTRKVFIKEKKVNKHMAVKLVNKAFPKVSWSENRHINVEGKRSPFDGDIVYWSKRNSKLYDGMTAKALKRQDHKCEHCGLAFVDDEKVELHHKDGNHNNWNWRNLKAVHRSCHQSIHMSKDEITESKMDHTNNPF